MRKKKQPKGRSNKSVKGRRFLQIPSRLSISVYAIIIIISCVIIPVHRKRKRLFFAARHNHPRSQNLHVCECLVAFLLIPFLSCNSVMEAELRVVACCSRGGTTPNPLIFCALVHADTVFKFLKKGDDPQSKVLGGNHGNLLSCNKRKQRIGTTDTEKSLFLYGVEVARRQEIYSRAAARTKSVPSVLLSMSDSTRLLVVAPVQSSPSPHRKRKLKKISMLFSRKNSNCSRDVLKEECRFRVGTSLAQRAFTDAAFAGNGEQRDNKAVCAGHQKTCRTALTPFEFCTESSFGP